MAAGGEALTAARTKAAELEREGQTLANEEAKKIEEAAAAEAERLKVTAQERAAQAPVDWKSGFQQCKGTEYNPELATQYTEDLIATSSAESEVYAAADAAKLALHFKYVCQEMELPTADKIEMQVDAGAAMGFIHNTGTIGRMKHIDLREGWIDILRSKQLKYKRVPGTENPADFFTKVIVGPALRKVEDDLMGDYSPNSN